MSIIKMLIILQKVLGLSYLVNYTYGNLQGNAQDGYTFTWKSQDPGSTAAAFSPELVGHDVDEFDIVLKYVSEYDLLAYGATVVEPDGDDVVAVGERTFSWDSDPENIVDKYGQLSSPLVDLDGNTITKAGWYDFTLRPTLQTENKLGRDGEPVVDADGNTIDIPVWRDGGRYIYADYYSVDYGIEVKLTMLLQATGLLLLIQTLVNFQKELSGELLV